MILARRGFITGLAAFVAAPAVVKASSLMTCAPTEVIRAPRGIICEFWADKVIEYTHQSDVVYLDVLFASIEQEAILARDFYQGQEWNDEQVGTMLRGDDGMPVVSSGTEWRVREMYKDGPVVKEVFVPTPQVPAPLALAAAAVAAAPAVLEKPVTRRFWSK